MTYPAPPWLLKGFGFQTFQLSDVKEARLHIPKIFNIISILPGKTPSGIYVAKYEQGSLSYSELIFIRGLVRFKSKIGFWCSPLFVDHPLSVQGGREIWHLPKQLADFHWKNREQVSINLTESIINIHFYKKSKIGIPLSFSVPLLTENPAKIFFSKMKISAKMKLCRTNIILSDEKAASSLFSCYYEDLTVMAKAPHQQLEK